MNALPMILAACTGVALAPNSESQCSYPPKQTLTPSVIEVGAEFGISVDIDGSVLVVGARREDAGGVTDAGAAYVFEFANGVWSETARLTAGDGASGDLFGYGVAVSGNRIAVGAPFATVSGFTGAGAAYVFEKAGPIWSFATKVHSSDLAGSASFGRNLAMFGDQMAVTRQGHVAVLEVLLGSWFETFETQAQTSSTIADVDITQDWFIMSHHSLGSQLFRKAGATWTFEGIFGSSVPNNKPKVAISNSHFVVSGQQGNAWSLPNKNLVHNLAMDSYSSVAIAGDRL